jgi:hypothetical protein
MATKMSAALGADGTATGLPGIAQAIREWRKA